jgi:hypothetical protein
MEKTSWYQNGRFLAGDRRDYKHTDEIISPSMYLYKTGIAQIDDVCGGLEAGTNILIPAPPVS